METIDFLRATLPADGPVYYLVLIKNGGGGPAHMPYSTLEEMAEGVSKYSKVPTVQVYHACATYLNESVMEGEKRKYRIAVNQNKAKAFWVDIDCGEKKAAEGKGYPSQREGAKAVYRFAAELGIPRPMLVDSGNGIHAYWPLDRAIPLSKWKPMAETLKACMAHAGVIAGPERTADFASILRPPGSINRKDGAAKEVKVKTECAPIHPKVILDALAAYKQANDVKVVPTRAAAEVPDINSDLTGLLQQQYPQQDTSGELIAEHGCLQIRAMRDTKGDVSYPVWFNTIGILKHCVDGEALAEDWTSMREATGHSQVDWRAKYDTWSTPPATCAKFESDNPGGCDGCIHRGKINTPMQIGRIEPEAKTEFIEDDKGEAEEVEMPRGFQWDDGIKRMVWHKRNQDGTVDTFRFCQQHVWVVGRTMEDGVFRMQLKAKLADGRVRAFSVPQESVASPADLAKALAKHGEVYIPSFECANAGKIMAGYLQQQLQALQAKSQEQNTYKTYGWHDGSFLMGNRLYLADSSTKEVITGGNATVLAKRFPKPTGTVRGYSDAVNRVYNRSGQEWAQYTICSAFGSILSVFGEELYHGVIVALQGGKTGRGKTTVCQAGLFAFGDATEMTFGGKDGFTINGLWDTISTQNNIPVLMDELTNIDPKDFSNIAYGISNGTQRVRSTSGQSGVHLADRAHWAMSPFVTGNANFLGLLSAHQANSQAEAVRLIQIDVDRYPEALLHDDPGEATAMIRQAVRQMRDNMGAAGDLFIRYVVKNQETVRKEIEAEIDLLAKDLAGTKYRYYRNHAACTLVAARIAYEMEILDFDVEAMRMFAVTMMTELAESIQETNTLDPQTAFTRMLSEFTPFTLISHAMNDGRKGLENVRIPPRGEIWARAVVGDGMLYIDVGRMREWCSKNRTDYRMLINSLEGDGIASAHTVRMPLTKGTDGPLLGISTCLVVDMKKVEGRPVLTLVSAPVVDAQTATGL